MEQFQRKCAGLFVHTRGLEATLRFRETGEHSGLCGKSIPSLPVRPPKIRLFLYNIFVTVTAAHGRLEGYSVPYSTVRNMG